MFDERLREANVACISLTASSIEMPDPSLRISPPKAAKVELGKHVRAIIMRPALDRSGYVAEGEWDVLADRFPKAHATALPEKGGVGVVPGGGVEPP